MNPNPNFSQWIARRPPQNPLGIIALFIILVEVIAGTVFGTSSTHLTDTQKLPFIYFLVIFPVVVFTVFTWLVIYHREKLYAPRDFLNPEDFFRTMTSSEQRQRLDEEAEAILSESSAAAPDGATLPVQPPQVPQQLNNTRQTYLLAEELALRDLEIEFGVGALRHVAIGGDGYHFDGMLFKGQERVLIQVKYTRSPYPSFPDRLLSEFYRVKDAMPDKPLLFLLAIVTDELTDYQQSKISERIVSLLSKHKMNIELRLYDFRQLQLKYGLLENVS